MKKILFLLLSIVLTLSLVACNNESQSENTTDSDINETTVSTPQGETWEKSSDDSDSGREAFADSKKTFSQNFGALVDLKEYDESEYNDTYSYDLKYENTIEYNLDYVINFYDGKQVTLPTTYTEMEKGGWNTNSEDSYKISNKVQTGIEYKNSNDESIILWTQNFDDSDEEKTADLKDCKLYALDATIFTEKTKKDEATGEYVKYYEKNNIPDFSICNGITQNSTIAEVVEKLGKPSGITYYEKSNKIWLNYNVKVNNWYSNISFHFIANEDRMMSMKYEYSYADLD